MAIKRLISFYKYIKVYPVVLMCKKEAIILKNEGYYDDIPAQLGLINEIIENPEKHYKQYKEHIDMFSYVEYLIYNNFAVS